MHRRLFLLALVSSAIFLSACGTGEPEAPQSIDERVLARWGYLIERDFENVWLYYSPGFRQMTPQADYARDMDQRQVRWHDAELVSIDCAAEQCDVVVKVTYQAVGAPNQMGRMRISRELAEQWILVDGQWWFATN